MSQEIIEVTEETTQPGVSRRGFIKGAIAASAAVSSSHYLFRSNGGAVLAQAPAAGAVERLITLNINGRSRRLEVPPMETPEDAPIVRAAMQALEEAGRDPTPAAVAYATDASMLSTVAGIPAVVLGPGDIACAHTDNEWIDIAELEAAVGVYRGICEAFARKHLAVTAGDYNAARSR